MKELEIFAKGISDTKSLYRLIDKLSVLSKDLYHNQNGTITQKVGSLSPSLSAIFNYLEQKGLEPQGDSGQKSFIEEIIKYLKDLPKVKVTLAFEPDDAFTTRLCDDISAQTGNKAILDILVNYHIIGGALIEFNGKYKDYSLEPRVDEYLKVSVQKFLDKEES